MSKSHNQSVSSIEPGVSRYDQNTLAHDGLIHSLDVGAGACNECVEESLNPFSRRYRYPFSYCTQCEPLFNSTDNSNIGDQLGLGGRCEDCAAEWSKPQDRRRLLGCHVCGPGVSLERSDGRLFYLETLSQLDMIDAACSLLQQGEVIAVKGLREIYLACNVMNEHALDRLRHDAQENTKSSTMMVRDIDVASHYFNVESDIENIWQERTAEPVLLQPRAEPEWPEWIRSSNQHFAVMLPQTPLQHLLLRRMRTPVWLSEVNQNNYSSELTTKQQLSNKADYFLWFENNTSNHVSQSAQ